MSSAWDIALKISSADVLYCVLPLYHSSGGILGVSAVITCGATMVVRRKFSASRFWDECTKYKATVREFNLMTISKAFSKQLGRQGGGL
jgi:acyl-CoA synthetase (AMP-forming)/AMP-acid ligase II